MPTLCSCIPPQAQKPSERYPPATGLPDATTQVRNNPNQKYVHCQRDLSPPLIPRNRRTSLRTASTSARGIGKQYHPHLIPIKTRQTPRTLPLFVKTAENNRRQPPTHKRRQLPRQQSVSWEMLTRREEIQQSGEPTPPIRRGLARRFGYWKREDQDPDQERLRAGAACPIGYRHESHWRRTPPLLESAALS